MTIIKSYNSIIDQYSDCARDSEKRTRAKSGERKGNEPRGDQREWSGSTPHKTKPTNTPPVRTASSKTLLRRHTVLTGLVKNLTSNFQTKAGRLTMLEHWNTGM